VILGAAGTFIEPWDLATAEPTAASRDQVITLLLRFLEHGTFVLNLKRARGAGM
jgi:hypothetical protein